MFFIHLKKNKGSALLTVIIIMAFLFIIGTSILSTSVTEAKQAVQHSNKVQANYLARTAVDDTAYRLLENDSFTPSSDPYELDSNSSFSVVIENVVVDTDEYESVTGFRVVGTGLQNSVQSKVALTLLEATISMAVESAIYSNTDIDISLLDVTGTVSSLGDIKYHKNKFDGDHALTFEDRFGSLYYDLIKHYFYFEDGVGTTDYVLGYPHGRSAGSFNNTLTNLVDTLAPAVADPVEFTDGEGIISASGSYETMYIDQNKLIIDTTSYDSATSSPEGFSVGNPMIIILDSLDMDPQGSIEIEGDGHVRIYVKDSIYSKGDFTIGNATMELFAVDDAYLEFQTPLYLDSSAESVTDPDNVRILLDKGSTLEIQANGEFNAYILGPGANIKLVSSQTTLNGFIIGDVFGGETNDKPNGIVNYIPPDIDMWKDIDFPLTKWMYEKIS